MNKIGLVIFNSAFKNQKILEEEFVYELSLDVEINGESLKNKSIEDLAKKVDEVKVIPKTSQPSTGEIIQMYEKLLKLYEDIIVLTPDRNLSGTHQNAVLSKDMIENKKNNIHIIETKSFALSESLLATRAIDMIKKNVELNEMKSTLESLSNRIETYIIPGNFEYLKMSGRVNLTKLIIGKMMMYKLLIRHKYSEGAQVYKKARGFKKILKEIDSLIKEKENGIEEIYFGYIAPDMEDLSEFKKVISKDNEIIETTVASVIMAAHFGPKTLGFMIVNKEDK